MSRCGAWRRCFLVCLFGLLTWASGGRTPAMARPAVSELTAYHAIKYPPWQRQLVARCVEDVMPHASAAERRQAVQEVLAFFHVVYHPTRSHRVENNVAVVTRFHDEIALACERFGVPQAMAFAILTWENSGGTSAESYAACVGMGQLSDGAVLQAHRVSARFARVELAAEGVCLVVAELVDLLTRQNLLATLLRERAAYLGQRARDLDLARTHERLRREARVRDERAVPRANIEDSVVFMRYLLEMYGGRADLAVSAYHNGVGNTDDLLRDYLERVEPQSAGFTLRTRAALFDALRRRGISYVTLWNDLRCRQMLNGLRTMDGDVTTPANASQAMGDESDIYLWKTLAALAATRATPQQVTALSLRYAPSQGEAETAGFTPQTGRVEGRGVRVTREMHGYLNRLEQRLAASGGARKGGLHVREVADRRVRDAGVAVDLQVDSAALARLLYEDWLFDRIYKSRLADGRVRIFLNPRFGDEFFRGYARSLKPTRPTGPRLP